jgi:hypothetical protein
MASKTHLIRKYQYSLDARTGGPGKLYLWGDLGRVADIGFVADTSPVPEPVIGANLNSATVWFKRSALSGLIALLRNQKPVGVRIDAEGHVDVFKAHGLIDSLVVCSVCAPALVAAKTSGILEAMQRVLLRAVRKR